MTGTEICALDDLDDPGARGFTLGQGKARRDIFLVRKDGAVFAYLNRCPHANQPLDARPGRFLTQDESQIVCGGHAALFRIEDGLCTSGPCVGRHLESIAVEVADCVVRIAD
ncbi:Rieske (2Fe-2S) protein [Parvibaculum sp.]|uniref:Rieske (2Fe-2S) protein n=1 Tax=Parvibaculum sp. TaxID=2024848 RepID=UPI0039198C82